MLMLAAFETFCLLANRRRASSKTVCVLISWPEAEADDPEDDEVKLLKMEELLRKWEKAMRTLPRWVEKIAVTVIVPKWFCVVDAEVAVVRMFTHAKIRTKARVQWECEFSRETT